VTAVAEVASGVTTRDGVGSGGVTARVAAAGIIAIHVALLALSLGDWRDVGDAGYHVSLARQWAEHMDLRWDGINYAPAGRPNLQGPLLHVAVGTLGLALGGTGDDYVRANVWFAFAQWAAAVWTVFFFARRFGGDFAALFAVSFFSGSIVASGSFAVGVPFGWLFVLAPWAVHFFLTDRLVLATLATVAAVIVHLGGVATVPLALGVAAALAGRWRELGLVGCGTALLSAPYGLHVVEHLRWYRGRGAYETLPPLFDWLNHLCAAVGLALSIRRPREHAFLIAWAAAPAAWLIFEPARFFLHSLLAGSVLGALALETVRRRIVAPCARVAFVATVVVLTSLAPLAPPNVAVEALWVGGFRYPRLHDWEETRRVAATIERAGLADHVVSHYGLTQASALAVYAPLRCEKGHWTEVQPVPDPADDLLAAEKVYVLPIEPGDATLHSLEDAGLLRVHGGGRADSVVTLVWAGEPVAVGAAAAQIVGAETAWLGRRLERNTLFPAALEQFFAPEHFRARLAHRAEQRRRLARVEIALLVYAHALEAGSSEAARELRLTARLASRLALVEGDAGSVDGVSEARQREIRDDLTLVAGAAERLGGSAPDPVALAAASRALRARYRWLD
jgi:hypothetical protein